MLATLAQDLETSSSSSGGGAFVIFGLIYLVFFVLFLVGRRTWRQS